MYIDKVVVDIEDEVVVFDNIEVDNYSLEVEQKNWIFEADSYNLDYFQIEMDSSIEVYSDIDNLIEMYFSSELINEIL